MQRVPTGITGLDGLLYGGFLEGDAVLVAGAPGTGKSTLGMQFLYEGIMHYDEPGLFITFEEFPQQIYRDAMNFGWDFRSLEEEDKIKVLGTSHDLLYQDIKRHEGLFPKMFREIGAKRVVVDSITHFMRMASDQGELREIIYSLINALKREGLTPLLLRELVEGEVLGTVPEEYTADTVLHLTMERINGQRMRFVEVLKSRGSRHIPARSLFFIHDQGIQVVPPFQDAFFRYQEAISVGVPDLDQLMGGGIPYGAFYLFEVSPELHQEIIELNFIRETIQAQDYFFELTTTSTWPEKLAGTAASFGLQDEFAQALTAGNVRFLNVLGNAADEVPVPVLAQDIDEEDEYARLEASVTGAVTQLDEAFQLTSRTRRGRLYLDFTRLLTTLDETFTQERILTPVLEMIQQYGGVCLGMLNADAVPPAVRARLQMEADGIVRMWKEDNYTYIQVVKTVNSVLTPICTLVETNTPPFLKILQY